MKKTVYNIIWADDEVDFYLHDELRQKILRDNNLNVIATAKTGNEFREKFEALKQRIDAVITDANFGKSDVITKDEKTDMSGFTEVRNVMNELKTYHREIPFFLYTGKARFIEAKYTDGELDYFINYSRIFTKSEFKKLCAKIPQDVDSVASASFRIRNKYQRFLDAAKRIPENEETIFDILVRHEETGLESPFNDFTALRKIAEAILNDGVEKGVFPEELKTLNDLSRFLRNEHSEIEWDGFSCPPALGYSAKYFIDLTQDGSHVLQDLKLKADQYVRDEDTDNLLMSLVFIAMDLCLWYDKIADNNDGQCKWKNRQLLSGTVELRSGKLYCDNIELQRAAKPGDTIEFRPDKVRTHSAPHDTFSTNAAKAIHVDSYLRVDDYEIKRKNK
jgi:hypothetical protein